MVTFANPPTVAAPAGAYSHLGIVPAGCELVFLSGQVGLRPDGSLPSTAADQAQQVFANLGALLASQGLSARSIVKLSMFVVSGADIQAVRAARSHFMGDHRPTSTAVFVPQLVDPAWLVEVEAIAVKAAG